MNLFFLILTGLLLLCSIIHNEPPILDLGGAKHLHRPSILAIYPPVVVYGVLSSHKINMPIAVFPREFMVNIINDCGRVIYRVLLL